MSGTSFAVRSMGLATIVAFAMVLGVVGAAAHGTAPAGAAWSIGSASSVAGTAASAPANSVPALPANEVFGVEARIAVGPNPVGVAYDPYNQEIYVTNSQSGTVSVIDGATERVITNLTVGANPASLAYDSVNHDIYVVNAFQSTVSIISSANTIVGNFTVGFSPVGIAFDPANGYLYITQQADNSTAVYDPSSTGSPVTTIAVGLQPLAALYDPDNSEIYVANAQSWNVSIINPTIELATGSIPVGNGSIALGYDSAAKELFVANDLSNNTTIVSTLTNSSVGSIPGVHPAGIAVNPDLGVAVISEQGANEETIVNVTNNSVVASVPDGNGPVGVAWDATNGFEYIADGDSANVTVLGTPTIPPYPVTFTETGLPTGTSWTVTLNGTANTSQTSTIGFSEPNGTYSYAVTAIAGFVLSSASGSINVTGFPVPVAITFTQVLYSVTFTESGLASGALWSVTLGSSTLSSATTQAVFDLPNGSYAYTVPSVSGYSTSTSSGWANVTGSAVSVSVTFTKNVSTNPAGTVGGVPWWEIAVIVAAIAAVVVGVLLSMRRARPPTQTPAATNPPTGPGPS